MHSIILFLLQKILLLKAFQTKEINAVPYRGLVSLLGSLLFANKLSASIFRRFSQQRQNKSRWFWKSYMHFPCSHLIDTSGPLGYEILQVLPKSKFLVKHYLSLIIPDYGIFETASSVKSGRLWCSVRCTELSEFLKSVLSASSVFNPLTQN